MQPREPARHHHIITSHLHRSTTSLRRGAAASASGSASRSAWTASPSASAATGARAVVVAGDFDARLPKSESRHRRQTQNTPKHNTTTRIKSNQIKIKIGTPTLRPPRSTRSATGRRSSPRRRAARRDAGLFCALRRRWRQSGAAVMNRPQARLPTPQHHPISSIFCAWSCAIVMRLTIQSHKGGAKQEGSPRGLCCRRHSRPPARLLLSLSHAHRALALLLERRALAPLEVEEVGVRLGVVRPAGLGIKVL